MTFIHFSWICLVIGALAAVAGYNGVLMPKCANQMDWFASSGAVMASFGVVSEFLISPYSDRQYIPNLVTKASKQYKDKDRFGRKRIWTIEILAMSYVVVGSIIWGYAGYFK